MHQKFLLFLLCLSLSGALWSQEDETMRILETDHSKLMGDTLWTPHEQPKLVIVPFEPLMYRSQIDRSIGQHDGTSFDQIRENFRKGLDNLMFIETDQRYSVIRLGLDDPEIQNDLYYTYRSTGTDWRVLPSEKEEEKSKKFKLKKEKNEDKERPKPHGTYIQNGQIQSNNDGQERFMATVVKDSAMFDFMFNKYGAVLYVFINQFDVGPMAGLDYRSFESEEYQREIKVHYSVFTHKREIYSGVARAYFSSMVNSQKDILVESMPALSSDIAKHIPVLLSEDVNQ